uniref:Uncharacterized protein MANES_10G046600 n=1 Tax=Rhizophora mucronata TaxID=61149 RepID=A0A2P2LUB7_RHIMU
MLGTKKKPECLFILSESEFVSISFRNTVTSEVWPLLALRENLLPLLNQLQKQ